MSRYSEVIVAQGATHHWTLDETTGTTLADSIGTVHLTIQNSVALGQNAVVGKAAGFSRVSQSFAWADVNDSMTFDSTKDFSYSWIMYYTGIPGNNNSIISRRTGVGVNRTFAAFCSATNDGELTFDLGDNQSRWPTGWIPTRYSWYHVAFTYAGATRRMTAYVNGQQVASTTAYVPASQPLAAPFYIGILGGAPETTAFSGSLDEIAVFENKLLSGTEVALQYNSAFPIVRVFDGTSWNDADRRIL